MFHCVIIIPYQTTNGTEFKMQYQCFYLNPEYKLAHNDDAEVLFESDNLGECCRFVYDDFKKNKKDIAVYQASSGNYREVYQNKRRNAKGQFV